MDLDISPAFEERLNAHKVVTVPRNRFIMGDGDVGSAQRARPRSHSAPRTRQRASELVNNLYDRMGVNLRRGQVTDLTTSPQGLSETQAAPPPFLSRPTTPANAPGSNHGIFQYRPPDETGAPSLREMGTSLSFHDRYRAATSRGRALERPATPEESTNPTELRTRSLSRGRVAQRWPPARTEEVASPSQPQQQPQPPQTKSPYSPSRAAVRPSWMESTGGAFHNNYIGGSSSASHHSRSTDAEEKKEDHSQEINQNSSPSIQDRISVYGTKKGSTPKATRSNRPTRNVDPHYAAQFAVREHPPKIDIYADNKEPSSEGTDLSTVTSPPATNEAAKPHQQLQQTQQSASPPTGPATPLTKKQGSVAFAYMSAIQSPGKSPKSPCPNKPSVPPREIAVSSNPDICLNPNDSQSLAGFSAVSGDEFSNTQHKSAPSNATPAAAAPGNVKRQNWRTSQAPKTQQQTYSNSLPPQPPLVSPEVLERIVQERVRERMTSLEASIDSRLRQLVGAMEERVMARLDSIERKMDFSENDA